MTKATNKAASTKNTKAADKAVVESGAAETIVAAPAAEQTTTVIVAAATTKAAKARQVFAEAYPDGKTTKMQRKDIIAAMVQRAGLTPAGAATYLQNFKDKAGITVKRVAATA